MDKKWTIRYLVVFTSMLLMIWAVFACSKPASFSPASSDDRPVIETKVENTSSYPTPTENCRVLTPETAERIIGKRSRIVLETIQKTDIEALTNFFHPNKGVRFSPYAFVDPAQDLVITADNFKKEWKSGSKRVWGRYDGSGETIELTFPEYFGEFVYDVDFLKAEQVCYNTVIGQGNTINNVRDIYPDSIVAEYHFPGFDPSFDGMDWKSLRLVYEEFEGQWYLVAIVHDQWTT